MGEPLVRCRLALGEYGDPNHPKYQLAQVWLRSKENARKPEAQPAMIAEQQTLANERANKKVEIALVVAIISCVTVIGSLLINRFIP